MLAEDTDIDKTTTETPETPEETPQEETTVEEKPTEPTEDKTTETPTETTPEEKPDKKEDVDIDEVIDKKVQEKTDAIAKELSQQQADKIYKVLTGDEQKAPEEAKDKYQQYAEDFYTEHGRNPYWHEIIPAITKDVREQMELEKIEQGKKEEELKKQIEERDEKIKESFNKGIDRELNDLYASNKLPKIVNKDDPNDYGQKTRQALFKTMMDVNTKITEENTKKYQAWMGKFTEDNKRVPTQQEVQTWVSTEARPPVTSIKEIYYEHFTQSSSQPAGADAPISTGGGGVAGSAEEPIAYDEIHNKSFTDIAQGK